MRRLGRIEIDELTLDSSLHLRQLEAMLCKLRFVPTRVEYLWAKGKFEYVGLSPFFDELDDGSLCPTYLINETSGGSNSPELNEYSVVKLDDLADALVKISDG